MQDATISTRVLTRVIVLLIALWSFIAGIVLVGFHGASSGALGAGVTDHAGQRLVGAHLLILVPAYVVLALQPERYQVFFWLPFAGQLAIVLSVGYGIVTGGTDFQDGILAVAVSAILVGLLAFVWISEQRSVARTRAENEEERESGVSQTPLARKEV
jgi:hypothetical protein